MYVNSNNYIRKIDELGRIVIPKEVRSKLKIGENETILISCDDNKINISKYSYLNNYHKFINELSNLLLEIYQTEIEIYDREKLIYTNHQKDLLNKYSAEIIKDSTNIGKLILYSNNNINLDKLTKFVSRLISIFLATS